MTAPSEEAVLIACAQRGDAQAFGQLVESCRARLWPPVLRVTGNPHDAADAMQDGIVSMWLNIGSFRGEARFGTWAHRVVINASLALVRQRHDIPCEWVCADVTAQGWDLAEMVVLRDEVKRAVTALPDQFREALVLREYGGFSYAEIARYQGVEVQTVRSRLHRARAAVAATVTRAESGEGLSLRAAEGVPFASLGRRGSPR